MIVDKWLMIIDRVLMIDKWGFVDEDLIFPLVYEHNISLKRKYNENKKDLIYLIYQFS